MRNYWNGRRLHGLALAVAIGLAIAFLLTLIKDTDNTSMLRAGDFPGFYASAVILDRKEASRYFDIQLQREIENAFWPQFFKGAVYISVYPPYVGAVLLPLAWLPPLEAGFVFRGLCFFFFLCTVLLLSRENRFLDENRLFGALSLLTLFPVFGGVLGGQLTALQMFCLVLLATGVKRQSSTIVGVAMTLWLLKPQYGLLAGVLMLSVFTPGMLLAAATGGVALYLLGAAFCGFGWPQAWVAALIEFSRFNYVSNQVGQISLVGWTQSLISALSIPPAQAAVLLTFAWLAALLVLFSTLRLLISARRTPRAGEAVFLIGPAIALLSPQTLFYDLGLSLAGLWYFFDLKNDRQVWSFMALSAVIAAAGYFRNWLPVSPLLVGNLWIFFVVRAKLASAGTSHG